MLLVIPLTLRSELGQTQSVPPALRASRFPLPPVSDRGTAMRCEGHKGSHCGLVGRGAAVVGQEVDVPGLMRSV